MIDQPVQRVRGDYDRRWLVDDCFDLIVWDDSQGGIHGFQLCYDKRNGSGLLPGWWTEGSRT